MLLAPNLYANRSVSHGKPRASTLGMTKCFLCLSWDGLVLIHLAARGRFGSQPCSGPPLIGG
jgi:hypothetical protein